MTSSVPFRDTFWNVPGWAQILLYAGGVIAIALFAWGMWQRVRLWRGGLPEPRVDQLPQRVNLVARHALGQVRTLSQAYPGVMHAIMFWGFLALFMGTVLATIDYDITLPLFGYKLLKGQFYLFYETVLDFFGLFFVIGLGMAVWRRFALRPTRVDPTARFAGVLALLFVINLTGFVMEACRLAVVLHAAKHGPEAGQHEIQEDTARAAVEIAQWFGVEQLAILNSQHAYAFEQTLTAIWRLAQQSPDGLTARELRRQRIVEEADEAASILDSMVGKGILIREEQETGGRRKVIFKLKR